MTKKRLWTFVGIGVLILLSLIIYWFYFSKPDAFPTNEQLVEEINSFFPETAANVIQDTISVDGRHVLVPFISKSEDYGLSYWVWQKQKWRVASIDTKGQPGIWKINKKDPKSFYLVWNMDPKDQLSSIHFYFIRDRGYGVTDGIENYDPRVQLDKKISLREKTYGMLQLPGEWTTFMNSFIKVESAKQPDLFFNNFFPEQYMFFGWIPYDQSDKETFPGYSVNGNGFSDGNVDVEHVMILNEVEIEKP
jgi:hypothetical protein